MIVFLNESQHPVFSVDIPSGLHADTGRICGTTIKADATITFGHQKLGLAMPTSKKNDFTCRCIHCIHQLFLSLM
jgi:Uncharacterized conserved protein